MRIGQFTDSRRSIFNQPFVIDAEQKVPPTPALSGPFNIQATTLADYSFSYLSLFGNMIIRVVAEKFTNLSSNLHATINSVAMSLDNIQESNNFVVAIFSAKDIGAGTKSVVISGDNLARAAIRVGDVIEFQSVGSNGGAITLGTSWPATVTGTQNTSDVTMAAGSNNGGTYPLSPKAGIITQWNAQISSLGAWFGHEPPVLVNAPNYIIYPANSGVGLVSAVEYRGLKPILPDIKSIVNVREASHTYKSNGNISVYAGADSSIRIIYPTAQLKANQNYEISFNIVSHNGDPITADWCDGTSTAPLSVGNVIFNATRSSYDTTYNFIDIGNDLFEEEDWDGAFFEFTRPILKAIA